MEERDFSEIVEEKKELLDQSFRDSVATIDKEGKRNYIFPKKPNHGRKRFFRNSGGKKRAP